MPLNYPEYFEKFNVSPPRGVLFYGPPGTGKTLLARAVAHECSQGARKIAMFVRKGADCLDKYVGGSERNLRSLFNEARLVQPAIIFFDEIDGLAPTRSNSSRGDQTHISVVSTLLSLMDGLDTRGQVIVIGSTNRLDAIDPALRRPGRFDRELYFPLPNANGRRAILDIHTRYVFRSLLFLFGQMLIIYLANGFLSRPTILRTSWCRKRKGSAVRISRPCAQRHLSPRCSDLTLKSMTRTKSSTSA